MVAQVINLSPPNIFRDYCDRYDISKGTYYYGIFGLELRQLSLNNAEVIFNHMSSKGERVFKRVVEDNSVNLFLIGSIRKFKFIAERLSQRSFGALSTRLFNIINLFENYDLTDYRIGDKQFRFNNAFVMGILNVTPDSFSDGGNYIDRNLAVAHGLRMIDQGADILDIGGQSSRPGAEDIDEKLEIERIMPVLLKILQERPKTVISIDTTKNLVASKALECGAHIINDISGGSYDPQIMKTVAEHDATFIIMHMQGTPQNMQDEPVYNDLISDVYDFLYSQIKKAISAGIRNIFVDPGIGFGKTVNDNFNLINRLADFKSLSYPIVIGLSRKSFIGETLNLDIEDRDVPTSILESISLENSARIIRTHNVENGVMVRDLFNKTKANQNND
jgi:dihydropteroate synthase